MAGIDKTYVNHSQWIQARQFADETQAEQIRCLGAPINFYYDHEDAAQMGDDFVLWNTSQLQDVWLYQNCKLPFIQERLDVQYGKTKSPLFELITFEQNCISLLQANTKDISIDFWYKDGEDFLVLDDTDEVLVYGTTLMFKVLDQIKETIHGFTHEPFKGEFAIDFFGCNMTYEKDKFFAYKDSVKIEVKPLFCDKSFIKFPKVKYSFKKSDFKKYRGELIYFSGEEELFPLTYYKGWKEHEFKSTNLWRFNIPQYILNLIK